MLIDVKEFLEALEDEGADVRIDCYNHTLFGFSHETISATINRVNQEMSAMEYIMAKQRMCFDENIGKRNCVNCRLSSLINPLGINCNDYSTTYPAEAIAVVKEWMLEHPEEINE